MIWKSGIPITDKCGLLPQSNNAVCDMNANTFGHQVTNFSEFILGRFSPTGAGGGCPDLNGDASVNVLDLVRVANHFGQTSTDAGFDATADCNADNVFTIFDLVTVARAVGP